MRRLLLLGQLTKSAFHIRFPVEWRYISQLPDVKPLSPARSPRHPSLCSPEKATSPSEHNEGEQNGSISRDRGREQGGGALELFLTELPRASPIHHSIVRKEKEESFPIKQRNQWSLLLQVRSPSSANLTVVTADLPIPAIERSTAMFILLISRITAR